MTDRFRWLEYDGDIPAEAPAPQSPSSHRAAQLRQQKESSRTLLEEARLAWGEGEWEPALRRYSASLERDPDLAEPWAGQVRCLLRLGRLDEAQVWADKAGARFPDDAAVNAVRAVVLARLGRLDQAADLAAKASGADADLARYHGACGDRPEVEACLRRLVAAGERFEAALVLLELGQAAAARSVVEEALQSREDSPYLWLLSAQLAHAAGDSRTARERLERALRLRRPYAAADALRLELSREGPMSRLLGWLNRR